MRLLDLRIFLQRALELGDCPVMKARHEIGMAEIEMKLRSVTQTNHHLVEDHAGAVHVLHFEIGEGEMVANVEREITAHSFGGGLEVFLRTLPVALFKQGSSQKVFCLAVFGSQTHSLFS